MATDKLARIDNCLWAGVVVGLIELRKSTLQYKLDLPGKSNLCSFERVLNLESNQESLYYRSKLKNLLAEYNSRLDSVHSQFT